MSSNESLSKMHSVLTHTSAPLWLVHGGKGNELEPLNKMPWILKFVHVQLQCGTEPYWNLRQEEDSVIPFMTLSKILRFLSIVDFLY